MLIFEIIYHYKMQNLKKMYNALVSFFLFFYSFNRGTTTRARQYQAPARAGRHDRQYHCCRHRGGDHWRRGGHVSGNQAVSLSRF